MPPDQDPLCDWRREVQRRRELRGWTAQRAARETGGRLSAPRWRFLERGHEVRQGVKIPANPTRGTVIAIAEAVGWRVADALALAAFEPLGHSTVDAEPSEVEELLGRLTPRQRAAVIELVAAVLDGDTRLDAGGVWVVAEPAAPEDLLSRPDITVRPGEYQVGEMRDDG